MTHIAYRWSSDLFCEEDIVAKLTEYEPWSAWRDAGNDPAADDSEYELDDIADMFRIDRSDPVQVAERGFPERLPDLPTDFCSFCLNWFS
jgi:hypothetical protein